MIDADFAFQLVRWMSAQHGIRHVRLTGGEPLLYPALIPLVARLAKIGTLHEITLTTNGQALASKARELRRAGLTRINISLDTINDERFANVTRGGNIAFTLRGIDAAVEAGLTPVKINVVAQRGFNDDEIADLAEWGLARGCVVRFLEVMPIGPLAHAAPQHLVSQSEILDRLRARFVLRAIPGSLGQPATDYAVSGRGLRGVVGIVASTTRPFCDRCRRIRITSHGALVACVHDNRQADLIRCWDGAMLDQSAADAVLESTISNKPKEGSRSQSLSMMAIGG